MKITKLEKTANINDCKCKINVEITLDGEDFTAFDYQGFDMIPDKTIPDILVAVGRMYSNRIKKGKINDSIFPS